MCVGKGSLRIKRSCLELLVDILRLKNHVLLEHLLSCSKDECSGASLIIALPDILKKLCVHCPIIHSRLNSRVNVFTLILHFMEQDFSFHSSIHLSIHPFIHQLSCSKLLLCAGLNC